jgi:hypothetical protein
METRLHIYSVQGELLHSLTYIHYVTDNHLLTISHLVTNNGKSDRKERTTNIKTQEVGFMDLEELEKLKEMTESIRSNLDLK